MRGAGGGEGARGPGRGGEREWPAGLAGQRRAVQAARGGRAASRPGRGSGSPDIPRRLRPQGPEPAGTCGRKGAGRRVEARPAAGLVTFLGRPLALDPASAGRAGPARHLRSPGRAHGPVRAILSPSIVVPRSALHACRVHARRSWPPALSRVPAPFREEREADGPVRPRRPGPGAHRTWVEG